MTATNVGAIASQASDKTEAPIILRSQDVRTVLNDEMVSGNLLEAPLSK